MAAGDLTTLENVKQSLRSSGTSDEALLTRMITAYSAAIQRWLNRNILSASYYDALDGKGTQRIQFMNFPVTAVASVVVDGIVISPASGPPFACGYVFSDTMLSLYDFRFCRGFGNVQISYTAGYATVPFDIEQACIDWIIYKYRELDRIGQVSKSIAGEVVTFSTMDMPKTVATMLAQFRAVTPI